MSNKTFTLPDRLYDYLVANSLREPELLRRLRDETAADPMAKMQISPEQGQLLQLLVRLIAARNVLEIGVFTGYSSLSIALAMPAGGRLIACDVNERWTAVARRYWQEAGIADRIELRLAPALETMDGLIAAGRAGQFDLVFIDADKVNYTGYYERALTLLRPAGLIAVDNTLWYGRVADPRERDDDTVAIREFNRYLHADKRVYPSLVPIGDGMTLAVKLA